jgi:hypothetical protein
MKKAEQCPAFSDRSAVPASTSVARHTQIDELSSSQVLGSILAAAGILNDIEVDLLALVQRMQARPLDGRDMDEHIRLAAADLDEAKAFGGIEELNSSGVHGDFLSNRHSFSPPRRVQSAV